MLANKTEIRTPRFDAVFASAEIQAAAGKPNQALQQLRDLVAETHKSGFAGFEFQARLALARVQMKVGQTAAARAHLQSLAKDAAAKGYDLIARRAHAALT